MLKVFAAALVSLFLLGPGSAAAQTPGCYPYCDYVHDYGPYDYSYVRPGLDCYPRCGPDGSCAPGLACMVSRRSAGTITVRTRAPVGTITVRTTPTTATFFDPTLANPAVMPRRVKRARRR